VNGAAVEFEQFKNRRQFLIIKYYRAPPITCCIRIQSVWKCRSIEFNAMTDSINDHRIADRARTELHWTLVTALCRLLHSTQLPATEALSLAAAAIGAIYRDIAEAHSGVDGCCCGWKPDRPRDIAALLTALETATRGEAEVDLRTVRAAGRA
jgi:hypothetical protein